MPRALDRFQRSGVRPLRLYYSVVRCFRLCNGDTLPRSGRSSYPYTEQMSQSTQNQPDPWTSRLGAFAAANRRIIGTERRIRRQKALIRRKLTNGQDTGDAEDLLTIYAAVLQTMHERRENILREMNG